MAHPRARIVDAMEELKERRDAGEPVHIILRDVAEEFNVPLEKLRERAEASWGSPLEADRERNAAHFEHAENKLLIERDTREYAKSLWEMNRPYFEEHKWWHVDWNEEIERALGSINLDNPELESIARTTFLDEIRRFRAGRPLGKITDAPN